MTKIHHATAARMDKMGIEFNTEERGNTTYFVFDADNITLSHTSAKRLVDLVTIAQALKAEYPRISIIDDDEFVAHVARYVDEEGEAHELMVIVDDTDFRTLLADVLFECGELGFDPELGFKEDRSMVVPTKYRENYALAGDPDTCGDWVAIMLRGKFVSGEGKFDHVAFASFLSANGVELTGKWSVLPSSGQRGWQGRYRMNGRQKLEVALLVSGQLVDGAETRPLTDSEIEHLLVRHPKFRARLEA